GAGTGGPGAPRPRSQGPAALEGLAEGDLVGVLEVGADREPARQPGDGDVGHALAQDVGEVERGRLAGRRRVRRDDDLAHAALLGPADELLDAEVLRVDAVDRRERPAEDVVAAVELVRPLDRDDVARVLDDADDRAVAPLVLADAAARADGEVEADLALADRLLHLADGVGEREDLLL